MAGFVPIFHADDTPDVPVGSDDNSFQRGLRSGTTAAQGQLRAFAGRAGETVGANDFAADQYAQSKALQEQAATEGPAIAKFSDVHSLRDGLDYVGGQLGQAAPVLGVGIGAGLLARTPLGKLAAGTLSAAPFTVGGQVQAQQEDPVQAARSLGDRNLAAGGVGVGQAALQSVLPAIVGSKLAGAGVTAGTKQSLKAIIAKNAAEAIGANAVAGGGSEALGQAGATYLNPDRDTSQDVENIKEGAIGGAVVGAVGGLPGAAGEIAHSRGRAAAKTVGDAVSGASASALDTAKGLFKPKESTDADTAQRMAQGLPVLDDAAYANADPATAAKMEQQAAQTGIQKAAQWAAELAKDNLPPDVAAKVAEATTNLGDATNQAYIAGLKVAKDASAAIQKNAADLYDAVSGRAGKDAADRTQGSDAKDMGQAVPADAPLALRSEGDDGPRLAVANALTDVGTDPKVAAANARSVQSIIDMAETNGRIPAVVESKLELALGTKARSAIDLLTAAYDKVAGDDPTRRENFYKAIADLKETSDAEASHRDAVAAALPKGKTATRQELDEAVQALRNHAEGKGFSNLTPSELAVKRGQVDAALEEHFPGKSKQLMERFTKEVKGKPKEEATLPPEEVRGSEKTDPSQSEVDRAANSEVDATKLTTGEDLASTFEKPTYYGGGRDAKNPTYVDHPEVHAKKYGNDDSPAKRLLAKAEAENPDRSVNFVSALDHAKEHGLPTHDDAGKVLPHLEGKGLVEARGQALDGRLTKAELDSMSHDSQNFPHAESRLIHETGSLDATKITSTMLSKMEKNTGESDMQRKARAFFDGLGAATDSLGHKVELKDRDVPVLDGAGREVTKNGKTVMRTIKADDIQVHRDGTTLGDLKKVKYSDTDKNMERRDMLREMSSAEVESHVDTLTAREKELKALIPSEKETERLVNERVAEWKKAGERFDKERKREAYRELGNADAKEALRRVSEALQLAKDEVESRKTDKGEMEYDTTASDRGANIHVAAKEHSAKELVNKTSMDGSKIFTSTAGKDSPRVQAQVMVALAQSLKQGKTAMVREQGAKLTALIRDAKGELDRDALQRIVKTKDSAERAQKINERFKEKGLALPEKAVAPPESAADRFAEKIILGKPDDIKSIVDKIKTSDDVKALQAGLDALPGHVNSREVSEAINERIMELNEKSGDGSVAYEALLGHDPVEAVAPPNKTAAFDAYVKGEKYNAITDRATMERFLDRAKERYDELRAQLKGDEDVPNFKEAQDTFRKLDELVGPDSDRESFFEGMPEVSKDATKVDAKDQATAANRKIAEDYITKVLANTVKGAWAKILHAGEFVPGVNGAKDIIRLSVHSLDPLSVAMHESMHAFMQQLRSSKDHQANAVLFKAADTHAVRAQLEKFFAGNAEALAQIRSSSEERAAYMYQLWSQGKLTIGPKTETILSRIQAFIHNILGTWSNDARALHIMEYFQSGEYAKNIGDRDAVTKELMKGTNPSIEKFKSMVAPFKELANAIGSAGDARLRDLNNPAITAIADAILKQGHGNAVNADNGFIPAAREKRSQVLNKLSDTLRGVSEAHLNEALEALQSGQPAATPEARLAARSVRKMLDGMHDYLEAAGVTLGDQGKGKDYFPRVWDTDYLTSHQPEFRAMLEKYKAAGEKIGNVDEIMQKILRGGGSEDAISDKDRAKTPGFNAGKARELAFITGDDFAPFGEKNLWRTLDGYVTQATRRAEWASRFGDDSSKLNAMLKEAVTKHGATPADIALTEKYIKGINGTLGDHIDPKLRRAMGNMMVYQNIRLLPLAIFSSVIDPLGIVVRGGSIGDAMTTMKRGISEIPRNFQKASARHTDEGYQLAQDLGTIDNAMLLHTLGSSYSNGMTGATGRKINDTFFRYNLMEQFNTSMRVGATEAAVKFMGKHADGTFSPHSERWMGELGYKPGEMKTDASGRPLIRFDDFKAAGMSDDAAAAAANKMAGAINNWVDGAILRPNAAHKPVWANDPHFALMAHLKQFVYSFQHTIIDRVVNEASHGNYTPGAALASYVPVMIAADLAKGYIQGGGQQPDWKEGWTASDYIWSGVQRAGLLGTGQFLSDAVTHKGGLGALAGPTIEQLADATQVVGGKAQFAPFAFKALPANALYASVAGQQATDPNFAD